jgi:tRNA(fMet)-specific endonuclease VapC
VPALPWTDAVADSYGPLAQKLRQQGRPIGAMDTLIAAHALAEGLVLVTHNTRHFDGIEGLPLEDWAVPQS